MNFSGFDLNLLVAFDALMTERNVTRAAALANVSQPAMSAALSRMRHLFDDPLFIRSAEGLQPTARAREISVPVTAALSEVRKFIVTDRHFSPRESSESFTLGMPEYAMQIMLPVIVTALEASAPLMSLHVRYFSHRDESVGLLDAGKIDMSVGIVPTTSESRILTRPLLSDKFVTLVGKNSEAAKQGMSQEAFLALRHVLVSPEGNRYGVVDEKLRESGLSRKVALTLPSMFAVPALLAHSEYVSTILRRVATASAFRDEMQMFDPPFPLRDIQFHLLWHRRTDDNPAHLWLRELIAEACAGIE